jgi:hypothetical protein
MRQLMLYKADFIKTMVFGIDISGQRISKASCESHSPFFIGLLLTWLVAP